MGTPFHRGTKGPETLRDEHARALKACEVLSMALPRFTAADVAGCLAAGGHPAHGATVANWMRFLANREHLRRVERGIFAMPRKQSAPAVAAPTNTISAPSKAELMARRAR